jgi:hypothetical protein
MQTHPYLNALRGDDLPLADQLRKLAAETERLEKEGLCPIGAGIRAGRLCIELATSPKLAHLASRGEAAYYGHGRDDLGHWRRGTLLRRPVTVFWTERGN